MNCNEVEGLMPLYAGGDLENPRKRDAFHAHLLKCDTCRRSAEEWASSQSLIRVFDAPTFDADFFDSIRSHVRNEIAAWPARSALSALVAQIFRPKLIAYASAIALVVAIGALTLRSVTKTSTRVDMAIGSGIAFVREYHDWTPASPHKRRAYPAVAVEHKSKSGRQVTKRKVPVTNVPEMQASRTGGDSRTNIDARGIDGRSTDVASTLVRIEFQTRDPNVRIIWLKPQRTVSDF
jgi:hypothetical protein